MPISLRLSPEDANLIKSYAKLHKVSVSELVRRAVLEKIEDEHDLKLYERAMREHRADPTTYTQAEVEAMLARK